ncbi:metallothionein-like protein 4B [Ricinus communis]|uniref:EC protein III, putative n=1 Tax=Ricinus communis TaxID=3988 RepID=B9S4K8_RICCO|nr:metallothionein-like protein 4B [Ricinus communis]EEF41472.1 EC protein III, putative [Ricinus communis]|eukprot:XP_002520927.1 metallothionein-like protein 4B [Ricinus communis]
MADTRGGSIACNDRCGCPVPCPGGTACRCRISQAAGGAGDAHSKCSCGEHCGCNPCTCPKGLETVGVGRASCKCGPGCTCATCAS